MNVVLSEEEKTLGNWSFTDTTNGVEYNNDIVVTDKRFIYQKEHKGKNLQRSISRFDVDIDDIKGLKTFYGVNAANSSVPGVLMIICGIVFLTLGLLALSSGEDVGVFLLISSLVFNVIGFLILYYRKRGSVKARESKLTIQLETTKKSEGSVYGIRCESIDIPEAVAVEVVETLGSLIF